MAEFCKNCMEKHLGIKWNSSDAKFWRVVGGSICEVCGYEYLKKREGA